MIKAVEAVTFKLVDGTVTSTFLAATAKVNEWVKVQPGFLKRELSQLEDGSWLDIIHWTSAAEAMQASERFMTEPGNCECMSMMDPDSIRMSHGELHVAI